MEGLIKIRFKKEREAVKKIRGWKWQETNQLE